MGLPVAIEVLDGTLEAQLARGHEHGHDTKALAEAADGADGVGMLVRSLKESVIVKLSVARYEHLGDLEQAQTNFQAAVARQPCDASAHGLLGNLYRRRGQLDEALAQFEAAAEADPNHFTAWDSIAEILEQQGCPEEARAACEQAAQGARAYLGGDPHNAAVSYMLGAISCMLEDCVGARQAAELAV